MRDAIWPRLCVAIPSRHLQTQSAWLRDEDIIALDEALGLEGPGLWVISTSWYDEPTEIASPLSGRWELIDERRFL